MTLYQYLQLNTFEQANALWDEGKFLAQRQDEVNKYALYELGDFFVEVTYSDTDNKILTFKPFKSMTILEKYWEEVDLRDLG
jgi:hypothetical protein